MLFFPFLGLIGGKLSSSSGIKESGENGRWIDLKDLVHAAECICGHLSDTEYVPGIDHVTSGLVWCLQYP